MTVALTRDFTIHPHLLRHVIERQAPSLAKAGLEAAMNAVDAHATRLLITLDGKCMVIEDDGQGFKPDVAEIERVFGTFGEPHQKDDAYLGEFRMGRGQLFAHGATTYETGPFRFTVDIRNKGTEWTLVETGGHTPGCRITVALYQPSTATDQEELIQLIQYLPISVLLNGQQVNQKPQDIAWDFEDDLAWYRFGGGPLRVYNRGAFVRDYPAETWGLGGTVVSKARLAVTFGRNEIMRDCPNWQAITGRLDHAFLEMLRKRKTRTMPAAMRCKAMKLFISGAIDFDLVADFYLLKDGRGRPITLRQFLRHHVAAAGPLGDPHAFRAIETGKALVVDEESIAECGTSLEAILRALKRAAGHAPLLLRWDQLLAELTLGREIVREDDLEPHARAILFGAQVASRCIAMLLDRFDMLDGPVAARRVVAGREDSEDCWSDGETFISLNKRILHDLASGRHSFGKAVNILTRAYLRADIPEGATPAGEPGDMGSAVLSALADQALSHLHLQSLEQPEGVFRSPLTGDPMARTRWWNNLVRIRDLGDVGRAWAEDYVRRCAGFNVMPKQNLKMLAGIHIENIKKDTPFGDIDQSTWTETTIAALQLFQKRFGLSHWKVEAKGWSLRFSRDKPKGGTHKSRHASNWMLSAILGRRYSPLAVGWMREASALPHLWATDDLCSFAIPGGSQKSPRSADTIVRQAIELMVSTELTLAGHLTGTPRDLGRAHMNRLIQLHFSHFPSAYPQDDPEKLAAALLDACGKIEVSLLKTELPGQNGQMFDVLQIHDWWDGLLLPVTINEWHARRLSWPVLAHIAHRYIEKIKADQDRIDEAEYKVDLAAEEEELLARAGAEEFPEDPA